MKRERRDVLSVTFSPNFYIFTSYLWSDHQGSDLATGYGHHHFLPYHRDRLLSAAQVFGWYDVASLLEGDAGLKRISNVVEVHLHTAVERANTTRKVKVCVFIDSRFHVESTNVVPRNAQNEFPLPADLKEEARLSGPCRVQLDVQPTIASLFTTHKTSERGHYDKARAKAKIVHEAPTVAEVLLFNPQNEVTECSLSTPYFLRMGQWVTPPLSSGGNAGVTRRLALEAGLCQERVVHVDDLRPGEAIWISNGVRGFIQAILCIDTAPHPEKCTPDAG